MILLSFFIWLWRRDELAFLGLWEYDIHVRSLDVTVYGIFMFIGSECSANKSDGTVGNHVISVPYGESEWRLGWFSNRSVITHEKKKVRKCGNWVINWGHRSSSQIKVISSTELWTSFLQKIYRNSTTVLPSRSFRKNLNVCTVVFSWNPFCWRICWTKWRIVKNHRHRNSAYPCQPNEISFTGSPHRTVLLPGRKPIAELNLS